MIELFLLLTFKHAICDLGLQSQYLWGKTDAKKYYFGCHSHYLHHGIGTIIILLLFVDPLTAVLGALFDYVAHWHIDFLKHTTNNWVGCSRSDKIYWWIIVADQIMHFLTYYLLVLYVIPD